MIKKNSRETPERWALLLFTILSIAIAATTLAAGMDEQLAQPSTDGVRKPVGSSLPAVGGVWSAQGPGPILYGQVEGIIDRPVSGAIDTIVADKTNPNILWVGSVNGGIWKTTNAMSSPPTWTAQTDTVPSLSIRRIERDPTDGTNNTLVAGTGFHSSYLGLSGPVGSLLRTTDGGTTWSVLTPSTLVGKSISGIAARGSSMVVAVNNDCDSIYRSTDTGVSFSLVPGLPQGQARDLASDPTNNAVLYIAIMDCTANALSGVYRSADMGATWTRVSNSAMNTLLASSFNTKISIGSLGQIYVGIVTANQLAGIFRSGNGGASWTQLDTPTTTDSGIPYGIHPGLQGSRVFSIAADPTDVNVVYVGGDSQPLYNLPNSIGAEDYTGRLFRVNAAAISGSQSTPLTHCQTATAACNSSVSTNGNSSPHADSRAITFDANGNLIETDDGGVYRRTSPAATGDWFSVNGNLQITEMHSVVYDRISNMIMGGSQDNGTSEQIVAGGSTWTQVEGGDGGDVSVDDSTSSTQSTRYSSAQYLLGFYRRAMNSSGVMTSWRFPSRIVIGGGPQFQGQFTTPVELNRIDPRRILFAGDNDLYESLDRGDTITALGLNKRVVAMTYGGRASGVDNLDVVYAIVGSKVFLRTAGGGAPAQTAASPGTFALRDIAADVTDGARAYVVNEAGEVFSTSNSGAVWTNITGNLGGGTTDLRTIIHIPGNPSVIAVGGVNGVFRMDTNNPGVWNQFGTGMSNAIVYDLDYDALDDTLVAGTLGRGAWKLNPIAVSGSLPSLSINDVTLTEGNIGTMNAVFTVSLTPTVNYSVGIDYATANGTAIGQTLTTSTNDFYVSVAGSGNATPYPSIATVAGITDPIRKVTVTLKNFFAPLARDVDMLLVGPAGQAVMLMSDVGGNTAIGGIDLICDDAAATQMPQSTMLSPGTYQPTDFEPGDAFSSPAPSGPYGTQLSVFNGTSANGTWKLYVVDDDSGNVDQGLLDNWSLTFTTGDYSPASGTLTFYPGTTSRTVSIPVHGETTAETDETFFVNLSNASNATLSDAQGQATILNDDLAPPTNVVAVATGTTNVNITWTAAVGASTYRVFRSSGGGNYTQVGETIGTILSNPASANTAYLYKVRSFAGGESGDSNVDLATTVAFSDPTLTAGTTIVKLAHFTELLTAVNAVRTLAGQGAIAFTEPNPTTSVTVQRQHVLDLRSGLDAARATLVLSSLTYTDPSITAGSTQIKTTHVTELRDGVK